MQSKVKNAQDIRCLLVDSALDSIDATQWAVRPSTRGSKPIDTALYEFLFANTVFFDSNFVINAAELNYVQSKICVFRERTLRKQRLIERDLIVARRTGNRSLYLECHRDLKKLNRQFWNLGSVLKSKVLVKRKGTERSRSKSGAQTICTHTNPIFEEGCEQRWLLGLAVEISRAANARNRRKESAPHTVRPEALRLTTQYFANAKTDVRQRISTTQIRSAASFREGKQMGDSRPGSSLGLSSRDESYYCYPTHWRRGLCRDDTTAPRVVRLRPLGRSDRRFRLASCSISPS